MYQRVMVGTDGSVTATRAVDAAAIVARAHGAELIVAHAFPPRLRGRNEQAWYDAPTEVRWRLSPGSLAEATVNDAVQRARRHAGPFLTVGERCEPGPPVSVLLGLIDELDPDVLVIGNRDLHDRFRRHRSVARALSRRAPCDVIIVDTIGRRLQRRNRREARVVRWA